MASDGIIQTPNSSDITTSIPTNLSPVLTSMRMDFSTAGLIGNASFQNYSNSSFPNSTITTTTVKAPTIEDFLAYQIANNLDIYFSPFLIILGLIGNILSLLVLTRTSMKRANSSLYLCALAIFDIGVLIVGLGYRWSYSAFDVSLRNDFNEWGCKLHFFFTYTFIDLSAWMLVCVTVDRVILVYLPLKAKSICTKRKTIISICIVTLFIMGVNCHWLFTVGKRVFLYMGKEYPVNCYYQEGFEEFHQRYWPWIDAAIASLIPFAVLIICNILISLQLLRAGRMRKKQMNVSNSKQDDTMRSMTIMLVTISFVFLCLTSPVVVELIRKLTLRLNPEKQAPQTLAEEAHEVLVFTIVNMLMYLNSAVNFFMYCVGGRKFRDSLRELFCGKKSVYKGTTRTNTSTMSMSETEAQTKVNSAPNSDKAGQIKLGSISGSAGGSKMDKVLGR
ncbi:unnamed protein product [Owenia fusiformis]|uniref:Uncharacterized protein n=1 Tax=Owenia fusiformis TaxID=6347 RepID=A0A8J1XPI2_OWEFU|nr:unnamed protein product [Owenia fusiformis]